jgi:hypothetical protein
VVECLPSKCKVLSSNPSNAKQKYLSIYTLFQFSYIGKSVCMLERGEAVEQILSSAMGDY